MLIPKGFAWAIVDEKGELVWDFLGSHGMTVFAIYPTKKEAIQSKQLYANERIVKVKIEIIK